MSDKLSVRYFEWNRIDSSSKRRTYFKRHKTFQVWGWSSARDYCIQDGIQSQWLTVLNLSPKTHFSGYLFTPSHWTFYGLYPHFLRMAASLLANRKHCPGVVTNEWLTSDSKRMHNVLAIFLQNLAFSNRIKTFFAHIFVYILLVATEMTDDRRVTFHWQQRRECLKQ